MKLRFLFVIRVAVEVVASEALRLSIADFAR